jgi:hypothetical protein
VVREDPDREGLLYAGTEYGMFISFDNGASWHSFQQNLPATVISDAKVYRKDLIIATQGRGYWIVDNLTPLHQMTDQVASAPVHLFTPREAYRMSGNSAPIDFYLEATPRGAVMLEILDPAGNVIRAIESTAATPQAGAPARPGMPGAEAFRGRMGGGSQFTAQQGLNRAEWDMRADAGGRAGPAVPPGQYTVRLRVPGQQPLSAPLTVALDPRLVQDGITAADLQAQYELALKVAELAADVQQIQTDLRAAIQRFEQANNTAALERARVLEAQVVNAPTAYPQQMLAAQVSFLNSIVSRGDNRPHRDAFERYEELRGMVDRVRGELDALR